jgi:hypothetical protein
MDQQVHTLGGDGIQSNQSNGGTATVTIGSSIISSNNQNLNPLGVRALLSYQTNQVFLQHQRPWRVLQQHTAAVIERDQSGLSS